MSQASSRLILPRRKYMHTETYHQFSQVFRELAIPMNNVTQTKGDAPQSKGVHFKDGTFKNELGQVEDYCAAWDFSLEHPHDYNGAQIGAILVRMLHKGLLGFWRTRGQGFDVAHCHCIDTHLKMKAPLQIQVSEWLDDGDGLKGDRIDQFWQGFFHQKAYKTLKQIVRDNMVISNKWKP